MRPVLPNRKRAFIETLLFFSRNRYIVFLALISFMLGSLSLRLQTDRTRESHAPSVTAFETKEPHRDSAYPDKTWYPYWTDLPTLLKVKNRLRSSFSGKVYQIKELKPSNTTKYVIVQVENRFPVESSELYIMSSIKHNFALSRLNDYEYVLFISPNQLHLVDGIRAAGYWAKVQFIYLSLYLFPKSRGILYLDTDAFLGNISIEDYLRRNHVDLTKTPILIPQENSHWYRTLKSFNYPPIYNFTTINTGSLLLNPQSQHSKELLRTWWLESTAKVSPLEIYCRCIQVQVSCSVAVNESQIMKLLRDLFGLHHDGHFFKCHSLAPIRSGNVSSVQRYKNGFVFSIRAIQSVEHFDEIVNYSFSKEFKESLLGTICAKEVRAVDVNEKGGVWLNFLHNHWPGDQERLQWIIQDFANYTHIANNLASQHLQGRKHHNYQDLSVCQGIQKKCLIYHPCSSLREKQNHSAAIEHAHSSTNWRKAFPKADDIERIPVIYLGEDFKIDWGSL